MTEYTDVPQVAALYQDRENVTLAITMLDEGGNVSRLTVNQTLTPPTEAPPSSAQPSVMITVPMPNSVEFRQSIRDWLIQRQAEIDAELATLGVTDPPDPSPPADPANA